MYKMKKVCLVIFIMAAIVAYTFADDDDHIPCNSDSNCEWGDCCAAVPGTPLKFCRDKPDDHGEPCGGPFQCKSCGDGLKCVPVTGGLAGHCRGSAAFFDRLFK